MSAVVSVLPHLQPTTYPLSELFADLVKTLPSYLRTTNAVFCRVIVNKLDEYGLPRTIMYPNATTKNVRVLGPEFSYIVNKETGKLYYDEPRFVIAIKCLAIFFATPLYTLGIMLWNAHQIVRSMVIIARNALDSVREDLMYGRLFDAARILAKEINPFPSILKERIRSILRAPFFGLGLGVFAFLGILRPLHGRQWVAMIEKAWHDGASYRDHLCRVVLSRKEVSWTNFWKDIHAGKECFLAYCFLERGNVYDEDSFAVVRSAPVSSFFG